MCIELRYILKIEYRSILNNIDLYNVYLWYKEKDTDKANGYLDYLFKTLPEDFNESYGWIEANALMLAQNGDTTRTLKLLSYVQSAEEKNKILLNICYQLQDGPGVEYTYFYLNELLRNYSKDAKIGMALYRVLGKIGGYDAEKNQARNKYRNIPELMKPKALQNWVLGTAENGNYYKFSNGKKGELYAKTSNGKVILYKKPLVKKVETTEDELDEMEKELNNIPKTKNK